MIIQKNHTLKPYNTFNIDVFAYYFVNIQSVEDLKTIYYVSKYKNLQKMVLGSGSNILFTRNYHGIIAKNEIKGISIVREVGENVFVEVGAGENWHQYVLWCVSQQLWGVENLALIPGTVGAAPMQNIGAYGVEIKDVLYSLNAYNIKENKVETFYNKDCLFGYRDSIFKNKYKNNYVITKVVFQLSKKPKYHLDYGNLKSVLQKKNEESPTLESISNAIIRTRIAKLPDPLQIGNAGSFFKNPIIERLHYEALKAQFSDIKGYSMHNKSEVKISAGQLIEKAGWKGKRKGDAGIHPKHALIFVNYGKAKGNEILQLANEVKEDIQKKFGISLEMEVNIMQ